MKKNVKIILLFWASSPFIGWYPNAHKTTSKNENNKISVGEFIKDIRKEHHSPRMLFKWLSMSHFISMRPALLPKITNINLKHIQLTDLTKKATTLSICSPEYLPSPPRCVYIIGEHEVLMTLGRRWWWDTIKISTCESYMASHQFVYAHDIHLR